MQRNRENAYDRFRRNYDVQSSCLTKKTAYFIKNHESSTVINVTRTTDDIPAVLVYTDNEGADEVILFVSKDDDFVVKDYFTWNNITFFAYEKVEVVKEVDYVKYKALQCNVFVNDSFWAYFKSTLRSSRDNKMSNKTEFSTIIPLLIAPRNEQLVIGGQINFNNQVWDIEDGDIFTINGIGYYYLSRGINSRDEEEYEPEEKIPTNLYYIGAKITVPTEMSYFKVSPDSFKFKIEERSINSVTIIPLESGNIQITTLIHDEPVISNFIIKESV